MLLDIKIPNNNVEERKYVIDFFFKEYFAVPYIVSSGSFQDYVVSFNEKNLVINDCFFCKYEKPLSYIDKSNIPMDIICAKNVFTPESDIPVIFGSEKLRIEENTIDCGIDIFASTFFLLTRWEEHVNIIRDQHNRFPGSASVAYKCNFLHRPIVNEYAEMLWNMLIRLGYKGSRKLRRSELFLTHDIDHIHFPKVNGIKLFIKNLYSFKFRNAGLYFYYLFYNPYNTFDWLMDLSEKYGQVSRFYFKAASKSRNQLYDSPYYLKSRFFKRLKVKIVNRKHIIGFHPGYNTFDNPDTWGVERSLLNTSIGFNVTEGRQHFLRLNIPETFEIWDNNNMLIDSSAGYADIEGFRCGTGDEFNIFDFKNRRILRLKERPLIIMEGTLKQCFGKDLEQAKKIFFYYIDSAKKYSMPLTLLFHNSSFNSVSWKSWDTLYEKVLCYFCKDN